MNYSEHELISRHQFETDDLIMVDVGAHEGSVSKQFASLGWTVIAFEPEMENRKALRKSIYGMKNIIVIPKAVSDRTGELVKFYTSDKHYGIHALQPFHETHKVANYKVATITIDDALSDLLINNINYLKIDIEGADFLALKGFDFDKKTVPEIVMVEFMDSRTKDLYGYTHHDMCIYMGEFDYTCYVSEWGPIKEYGRKGIKTEQHAWLDCNKYPLRHEPVWGNLIFIQNSYLKNFENTLKKYLLEIKEAK